MGQTLSDHSADLQLLRLPSLQGLGCCEERTEGVEAYVCRGCWSSVPVKQMSTDTFAAHCVPTALLMHIIFFILHFPSSIYSPPDKWHPHPLPRKPPHSQPPTNSHDLVQCPPFSKGSCGGERQGAPGRAEQVKVCSKPCRDLESATGSSRVAGSAVREDQGRDRK